MVKELRNESGLDFTDISSEAYRIYVFPNGEGVKIDEPQWLNVSTSGGHRILDIWEVSHYIPPRWLHLYGSVRSHKDPHFVK